MLIDIPVLIAFDCPDDNNSRMRTNRSRVFTMRYDTDPNAPVAARFCTDSPPTARSHWNTDEGGVLFSLLTSAADKQITECAEDDPDTYAVKV